MCASWCQLVVESKIRSRPYTIGGVAYNHSDADLFWNTFFFHRTVFLSFATIYNSNSFLHSEAVLVTFLVRVRPVPQLQSTASWNGMWFTDTSSDKDWKATGQWYEDYLLRFGYSVNLPVCLCNWTWGSPYGPSWGASALCCFKGAGYALRWCGHNLMLQPLR